MSIVSLISISRLLVFACCRSRRASLLNLSNDVANEMRESIKSGHREHTSVISAAAAVRTVQLVGVDM